MYIHTGRWLKLSFWKNTYNVSTHDTYMYVRVLDQLHQPVLTSCSQTRPQEFSLPRPQRQYHMEDNTLSKNLAVLYKSYMYFVYIVM